jgi:hypothetical protein
MRLLSIFGMISLAYSLPVVEPNQGTAIGQRDDHADPEEAPRGTTAFRCGFGGLENHHYIDPIEETPGPNFGCRYTQSTFVYASIRGCHCSFFRSVMTPTFSRKFGVEVR